jgi:hypothetical protein
MMMHFARMAELLVIAPQHEPNSAHTHTHTHTRTRTRTHNTIMNHTSNNRTSKSEILSDAYGLAHSMTGTEKTTRENSMFCQVTDIQNVGFCASRKKQIHKRNTARYLHDALTSVNFVADESC